MPKGDRDVIERKGQTGEYFAKTPTDFLEIARQDDNTSRFLQLENSATKIMFCQCFPTQGELSKARYDQIDQFV